MECCTVPFVAERTSTRRGPLLTSAAPSGLKAMAVMGTVAESDAAPTPDETKQAARIAAAKNPSLLKLPKERVTPVPK
jgi:hypothetical protein